ncbi:efflux RND transporter permease subunit [Bradyrhizobium australiense]|uniref:efflux RND transporter permease subunit n=1 Tax=Bradyrhizobium australiense TaxID=2721161 RepID=UPI001F41CE22|nr:CusA/CzcA family heavy metal efflux RND transporter [Bradyrhizobium australiense]
MIEKILDLSVRSRWFVVLLTAVACALGIWSLNKLPIDAVPDVTNNQVQINAIAPALTPVEMEKQITFQIENALAGTPTLEHTRSFSRNGFAQVTAVFSDKTNIYFARQQVNERLQEIRQSLPPEAEVRLGPISTGLGEVYWWALEYQKPPKDAAIVDGRPGWQSDGSYLTPEARHLRSDFERAVYLRTVQDWIIRPQMRMVPGIAGADAIGGYVKQYQIAPDPAKSIAYGISFADIVKAVQANNVSRGANYVERNGENYVVRAAGRIEDISEIGEIVVATRGDTPLRVKDLADILIGRELRTGSASVDGHEAVLGTALMLIGGNSRTVSAAAAAKIEQINATLPPGIVAKTLLNRTQLVDSTIYTVAKNLAEGAFLVILILFALLGNFRAALIAALVIPAAMLLTATGMLQVKVSANLMSLGAIDFGLIVDGAVIITENCLRHLAARQHRLGRQLELPERLQTVRLAAREMVAPSVYGQAVIMLVYVPLLTFSGVEGKMFEPMALTVIIALLSAFVLSLTFVPAMIAIAVTGRVQEKPNRMVQGATDLYRSALTRTLKAPGIVVSAGAAVFALSILVFLSLGQEFNPTLDEKNLVIEARRIPSTSLAQSQAMQLDLEHTVSKFREVAFVFSRVGTPDIAADPMPPNAADAYVILKPQQEWPDPSMTKAELVERIESELQKLPGTRFSFSQPIQMRFNELIAGVREDIAVKIFGDEFEPMLKSANQIVGVLRSIGGAQDVRVEEVTGLPFVEIAIDKKEISRRGLSIAAVQDVIGAAIGGREAGLVFEGDRRFQIVVRLSDAIRTNADVILGLPVPLPGVDGQPSRMTVPLRDVASLTFSDGPNQVSRENGKRRVVVTANVRGRDIGSVVQEAQQKISQRVVLPPGYWITWGGQFENLASARERLSIVVPACFAMIFLILFAALGSARDALLVFSAVPLALSGGIVALWLRGMPFSVSAAVGFIALSGVAVLNGLVMLTFIKQLIASGLPPREAIVEGAVTRLRPVAMTALVASVGFVPMALATGTGAEVQKPLATVVIGGLMTATFLTLFVLPALYRLVSAEARAEGDQLSEIDAEPGEHPGGDEVKDHGHRAAGGEAGPEPHARPEQRRQHQKHR